MPKLQIETGDALFDFGTFSDWVNNAKRRFKAHNVSGSETICVDKLGRLCLSGREFMRARDEKSFPVTVYKAVN